MARWQPRTLSETFQSQLSRIDRQIANKEKELKSLKTQKAQAEQAIKAMNQSQA